MKKLIRSVTYQQATEKAIAAANLGKTKPERFLNLSTAEKKVVEFVVDFYANHSEPPQFQVVLDHFDQAADSEAVSLLEEAQPETFYDGASFKRLMEDEIETQASQNLASTCKEAIKIASQGVIVNNQLVKGTNEAVAHLFAKAQPTPRDDTGKIKASMRANDQALTDLYQERKNSPQNTYGILTGYGLIDQATAGVRKKQFRIHAGFGGHLKSTQLFNEMVNAAVDGGWNPLLFTTEMPADDVQQLLVAIHSGNPRFNGVGRPINAFRLLLGALRDDEYNFYLTVKDDLLHNPDHGNIRVIDTSEFTTWGSVMQRTVREHADEEVDLLWADYITRMPVDHKYARMDITSARNETLADAKRFAMSFDGGIGLPVCTPFQVNREGYKKALENGGRMNMCQPLDARVLTPSGWRSMGSLQVGEEVIGRDGTPKKILEVKTPGIKQIYRLTTDDGASTRMCGDHLWSVKDNRKSENKYKLMSTKLLLEKGLFRVKTSGKKEFIYRLPVLVPSELTGGRGFVDPYLIGLLIGDGTLTGATPSFVDGGACPGILGELEKVLPKGIRLIKQESGARSDEWNLVDVTRRKGDSGTKNFLTLELERLGLMGKRSWEKCIPEEYMGSPVVDRVGLLQGLMDTDGCVKAPSATSDIYVTTSEVLAAQVVALVRSLGGVTSLRKAWGTNRMSYRVRVSMPAQLRKSRAKVDRLHRRDPVRMIRSIEEEGKAEVKCLLIDSDDHLYVTDDFIVTHNTALGMYNAAEKEADIITYIFYDKEEKATSEPKEGVLKARWGAVPADPVSLYIDPDCRRIYDMSAGMGPQTGYAPTGGGSEEEVVL